VPDSYSIYGFKLERPPKACDVQLKKHKRCMMVNEDEKLCG